MSVDEIPEIKLIHAIIYRAFLDAFSNQYLQHKFTEKEKFTAIDFLTDKDNKSLTVYLGYLGIDEKNFRHHAQIILNTNKYNFCSDEKRSKGIDLYSKELKVKPDKALDIMYKTYINNYIKFIMSEG